MALKPFRPLTPSQRFTTLNRPEELSDKRPERGLVENKNKSGGRNCYGRLTSRRRGGGHKQLYRIIDFKRAKLDMTAKVEAIEYDPNRTAHLALLCYTDGEKTYILAPKGLKVGDTGSAGVGLELVAVENGAAQLKMPSGEIRVVNPKCRATIGEVGNAEHGNESLGKAGRNRWLGRRPRVRGMAMNPVDHPNGGGQGKSKGGGGRQQLVSPWGQLAKGFPTRRRSKPSNSLILVRANGRKPRGKK